jgi:hypothetical protein
MYNTFGPHSSCLALVMGMILMMSCQDIFERDLEGATVTIIAPSDSIHMSDASVKFDWEEMEEVAGYRIQVARPDFSGIEELVYDSLVSGNTITLGLYPGSFEWRIRPENSASYGDYILRSIFIDSTDNLSGQEIILVAPLDNAQTNSSTIDFCWQELYNASSYRFVLRTPDWNGEDVLPEAVIDANGITIESIPEGEFEWGVRGEAALSNTPFAIFHLTTDYTAPGTPELVTPSNGASVASPVLFSWNRAADDGTTLRDSIYVYSDVGLVNLVWSAEAPEDTISKVLITGTYYWQVKSLDAAGNTGLFSTINSFYAQ